MTVLFTNLRIAAYLTMFAFSATVLGIASNFAKLFLPHVQHDFTIFSLVVPSVTILSLLCLLQFAQPVIEVIAHTLVGILWLTMGAWSSDIIGPIQCYQLGGVTTPTDNGSMSARSYCYQMKVIEAFSWATFIAFFGFVVIVISLTSRAVAFGRRFAWQEHISQLGWYGEWPGFPTEAIYPRPYYPGHYYPHMGGNYVNQMPGHSVVIQPGMGGGMPMISQVPGAVA